jgi:hypothetical protein
VTRLDGQQCPKTLGLLSSDATLTAPWTNSLPGLTAFDIHAMLFCN